VFEKVITAEMLYKITKGYTDNEMAKKAQFRRDKLFDKY